jgi:hypothetical protein
VPDIGMPTIGVPNIGIPTVIGMVIFCLQESKYLYFLGPGRQFPVDIHYTPHGYTSMKTTTTHFYSSSA